MESVTLGEARILTRWADFLGADMVSRVVIVLGVVFVLMTFQQRLSDIVIHPDRRFSPIHLSLLLRRCFNAQKSETDRQIVIAQITIPRNSTSLDLGRKVAANPGI